MKDLACFCQWLVELRVSHRVNEKTFPYGTSCLIHVNIFMLLRLSLSALRPWLKLDSLLFNSLCVSDLLSLFNGLDLSVRLLQSIIPKYYLHF
jgi:hypothetical protein